jgi:hypothetical protein
MDDHSMTEVLHYSAFTTIPIGGVVEDAATGAAIRL